MKIAIIEIKALVCQYNLLKTSIDFFFCVLFLLFMQILLYGMSNSSKQVCIFDTAKLISVKQDAMVLTLIF